MGHNKKLLHLIVIFIITLFLGAGFIFPVFASETDGTIDATNKYAWSENMGWINFGTSQGSVHITDAALTGYAWGENAGWISLNCSNNSSCGTVSYGVANDSEGNLSGYAWSENTGWINFAPANGGVTIARNGNFAGYAWGENTGWIVFNCSTTNSCATVDYKVATDWMPASARNIFMADTTSPGPVANFLAHDAASGGTIKLSWTNPSNSNFAQTYLYRGQTSDFTCDSGSLIVKVSGTPSGISSYTDTGLTNNQIYYYTARTISGSGNLETGLRVLYPTISATPTAGAATPTSTTAVPSTTTGTVTATASVGGITTVTTSDSSTAEVIFPANAVSADTSVSITPIAITTAAVSSQVAAVPAGQQIVGVNIYQMAATQGTTTSVSTFSKDFTISFTYTDAQVAGLDPSSLAVYYYDTAQNKWASLAATVDTATKTLTATANHFTLFAIFGTPAAATPPAVTTPTTPPATTTTTTSPIGSAAVTIVDGDIIKTADNPDVYIIKVVGSKLFRRLILNPAIFNSYGQLKWSNIKTVSQDTMNQYTISTLIMAVHPNGKPVSGRVYSLTASANSDVGVKHWLNMTPKAFEKAGYDWDSIYAINTIEASSKFYPTGANIMK